MLEVVVLGAGGVKGFLELGALYYLQKNGHLDSVSKYIGVSIGSMIALLMCSGYNVLDIILEMIDINISMKDNVSIKSIVNNMGLIDMKNIKDKMDDMIIDKW